MSMRKRLLQIKGDITPSYKRASKREGFKFRLGLLIGGILLTGFLGIWLFISSIQLVSNIANNSFTNQMVETVKSDLVAIQPNVAFESCWSEAKNLFKIEQWTSQTLEQNLVGLKSACLGGPTNKCESSECVDKNKNAPNQSKGGVSI